MYRLNVSYTKSNFKGGRRSDFFRYDNRKWVFLAYFDYVMAVMTGKGQKRPFPLIVDKKVTSTTLL